MRSRYTIATIVMASLGLILGNSASAIKFGTQDIPVRQIASLPLSDSGGRITVDQNAVFAFPRPSGWSAAELTGAVVNLTGPEGQIKFTMQPFMAQDALLIKPETVLAPGVEYVLQAAVKGKSQQLHLLVNGRKGGSGPSGALTSDLGRWIPNLGQQRDDWYSNLPDHSLPKDQLLQAPKGVTALSGQVRLIRDAPLTGATLSVGKTTVQTDQQGRFLLESIPAGSQTLTLEADGYGVYQVHVDLKAGQTTALPYTIWASRLATEHKIILDSPTKTDVVIKNPEMPGFELRVAKGTVIKDRLGKVVNELTITPLPIDRSPFPLPKFNIPTYFTIQPGAAKLYAADGKTPKGAQLVYPNYQRLQPGEGGEFWNYDPRDKGWYTYGRGHVSADGQQVVPDEGVLIYELTGAMFLNPTPAPPGPPLADDAPDDPTLPPKPPIQGDPDDGSPMSNRGSDCTAADPIDCSSGNFVWNQTDLALKDLLPVALGRSYIQEDDTPRAFGKGWASNLDVYISSSTTTCCTGYAEADLILPSGQRVHYIRSSPGTGYSDAELIHIGSQSKYYRSKLREVSGGWTLTLRDGSKLTMPWGSAMTSMTDRNGNKLTITRNGQLPTRITGPTGRYINITLDNANRISLATDDQGRSVTYAYDADGYLTTVTYPDGTSDQYSYFSTPEWPTRNLASHRDRRGVLRMTTEFGRYVGLYYTRFQPVRFATATAPTSGTIGAPTINNSSSAPSNAKVFNCLSFKPIKQIYPDGGFYTFNWTLDNYCRVMDVTIVDPKGNKTLREFNIDGHLLKETVAIGTQL